MKLVGGDSGHYEREEFVEEVLLAPSERVVVDVLFDEPGELALEHRTPERTYPLAADHGRGRAGGARPDGAVRRPAHERRHGSRARTDRAVSSRPRPTRRSAFVAEMDEVGGREVETGVYACPMHPEIVASWAGKCPKCGMKLMPAPAETEAPTAFVCPMHAEITATWAATCPKCGMTLRATGSGRGGRRSTRPRARTPRSITATSTTEHHEHHGTEAMRTARRKGSSGKTTWSRSTGMTTPANMRWKLVDRDTGAENAQIDWTFRVGDQVKLRLVNEMDSDHPMPHPFHVHGAGRFLILAETASSSRTSSGRTRCSSAPARRSTSCST